MLREWGLGEVLAGNRDTAGMTTAVSCDFIAGCDGDRGVSRAAIPAGALTRYSHEYGWRWAELQRQLTSSAANRLFGELTAGVN
jgi:p-hydroxybenzoate 3-monooxygenase